MNDKLDLLFHTLHTIIFALILITIHAFINNVNKTIDKIVQVADKAGVECNVKTNTVLHVTMKKIVD